MSYIKQNFKVLATICKRLHVDNLNGAPIGPFRVRIEILKNLYNTCIVKNVGEYTNAPIESGAVVDLLHGAILL